jgi:hypothetical protein
MCTEVHVLQFIHGTCTHARRPQGARPASLFDFFSSFHLFLRPLDLFMYPVVYQVFADVETSVTMCRSIHLISHVRLSSACVTIRHGELIIPAAVAARSQPTRSIAEIVLQVQSPEYRFRHPNFGLYTALALFRGLRSRPRAVYPAGYVPFQALRRDWN